MKQKKRYENGRRERLQSNVACPVQMKEYCTTFHLIDKGNRAETSYNTGGKSRTHNWTPKLVFQFYNMALNNAYKIFKGLVMVEDGNHICLNMGDAVKELAHALCQKGENIRTHMVNYLAHRGNMVSVYGFMTGTKHFSDEKWAQEVTEVPIHAVLRKSVLTRLKKNEVWYVHQNLVCNRQKWCKWGKCPGFSTVSKK